MRDAHICQAVFVVSRAVAQRVRLTSHRWRSIRSLPNLEKIYTGIKYQNIQNEIRKYRRYAILLFIATFVAYSYIYTTIIITNHTIPNSFPYKYPSFKTYVEGRWAADIFIQLTGGFGNQATQFLLAILIKAVNAIMFIRIFGIDRSVIFVICGLALALHPAFLDYYSFTVDSATFEAGDSLAIFSIIIISLPINRAIRIGGAAILVLFCLAMYQPKLALCAVLLLLWGLAGLRHDEVTAGVRPVLHRLIDGGLALLIGVLLYYVSVNLTVKLDMNERNHINSLAVMVTQFVASYGEVASDFSRRIDYLPKPLTFLPGLCLLLGFAVLLVEAGRRGITAFALAVAVMMLLPVAMQVSYVINDGTWINSGRILTSHGYILCFALATTMAAPATRHLGTMIGVILVFFFFVVANQESNAAALKTIFDVEKMNRIVARIESTVPDLSRGNFALVVIGELPLNRDQQPKRFANRLYGSQFATETFISYRQTELVNFLLGRNAVGRPDSTEIAMAIADSRTRQPWPAPDSVFLLNRVIVVLLQSYAPEIPLTWQR